MISEIISGIKAQIAITLPDFRDMDFELTTSQNRAGSLEKAFAVLPLGGAQNDAFAGNLRALTITRTFRVLLSREYYGNQINDEVKKDLHIELVNDTENLYLAMANTKLGSNRVLNIHDALFIEPTQDEKLNAVFAGMEFSVQYFRSL